MLKSSWVSTVTLSPVPWGKLSPASLKIRSSFNLRICFSKNDVLLSHRNVLWKVGNLICLWRNNLGFRNGLWDFKRSWGTSLVAQWLRICLPMPGTRVRALVREDPTCRRATKPMHHNYWACALEPVCHNYWSLCATTTETCTPRARAPQQEKPPQWEARTLQRRVAPTRRN